MAIEPLVGVSRPTRHRPSVVFPDPGRYVVSVEAQAMPNMPAEMRGIQAVIGKGKWWNENHTMHSASCQGPFPNGDRFACIFKFDVTNKPSNQRFQMEEVALYTVKDGKIVREEFFYVGG